MGIIDKCGVRGDATLCVVIFVYYVLLGPREMRVPYSDRYVRPFVSASIWLERNG